MNKDNYNRYVTMQKEFEKYLIDCAQEISQIIHDRKLQGEFNGDFELYEEDKYFVQFEKTAWGETNYDSVCVPVKYIYDEGYREYYKKYLIQKRRNDERAAFKRKKNARVYHVVEDERAEYERLKKKFGD